MESRSGPSLVSRTGQMNIQMKSRSSNEIPAYDLELDLELKLDVDKV